MRRAEVRLPRRRTASRVTSRPRVRAARAARARGARRRSGRCRARRLRRSASSGNASIGCNPPADGLVRFSVHDRPAGRARVTRAAEDLLQHERKLLERQRLRRVEGRASSAARRALRTGRRRARRSAARSTVRRLADLGETAAEACPWRSQERADGILVRREHLALAVTNVDAAPPRKKVVHGRVEVPAAVAQALVEVVAARP